MSALDVFLGDLYREASHSEFLGGPRARSAFDALLYYRCISRRFSGTDTLVSAPASPAHPHTKPFSLQLEALGMGPRIKL